MWSSAMARPDHPAAGLVDLDRYPIHDLESAAGQALLAECRAQLASTGGANLPGFMPPEVAAALTAEALSLEPGARRKTYTRNSYLTADDPSLPAADPRRRFWTISSTQLADDQIPAETWIRRFYEWDVLTAFIAAAMGKPLLYRMADPFQALNLIYLGDGDQSAWHYDRNEFTVTLLLQEAQSGGEFEFAPNIRTGDDENYDQIARVFDGRHEGVRRYERGAGTLTLFRGEYSLHRVAPVIGARQRITAILCYDERPDCVASDDVNILIYGDRIKPIIAARNAVAP
jgi:hypothetical protein